MDRYTHIIIDEVHERDINIDFLLIVVRRLLFLSPKTKIVLMSATMNAEDFEEYFTVPLEDGGLFLPPQIDLLDRPRTFKIEEFFMDEFRDLWIDGRFCDLINYDEPGISDDMFTFALKILVFSLRRHVLINPQMISSVLVFLPGIHEIDRFREQLQKKLIKSEFEFLNIFPDICILHSRISTEEQKLVFLNNGKPKIILATNIAESSVTIPNITHVLDFCLTKYQENARGAQISTLSLDWASINNCRQRTGRAGRVCPGVVIRMITRNFYMNGMKRYPVPEMQRIGLESVILKIKVLKMGTPLELLSFALDPPTKASVIAAVLHLKELGGLACYNAENKFEYDDGDLTFIGELMSSLPLDPQIVKFIVVGYLLGVCDDAIIIGAGLSLKSIFTESFANNFERAAEKLEWSHGSQSDCIAILNAYNLWRDLERRERSKDSPIVKMWCDRHSLNLKNLHEMKMLINEIQSRLLTRLLPYQQKPWKEDDKVFILKICIAGAFGPTNFFIPDEHSQESERDAFRSIDNQDLFRTVYFKNMNQPIGDIYENQIREAFERNKIVGENCDAIIKFDYPKSQKIFVTFREKPPELNTNTSDNFEEKIPPEVYKSVKMRQFNSKLTLFVMNPDAAARYAVEQGMGTMENGIFEKKKKFIRYPGWCVEPTMSTVIMQGYVTHVEHCSKFFFSPVKSFTLILGNNDDRYERIIEEIQSLMKKAYRVPISTSPNEILDGKFVVVQTKKCLQRGRLVGNSNRKKVFVYLIDYGSTLEDADINMIFFIRSRDVEISLLEYPPRMFECKLVELQPSTVKSREGKWSKEAIDSLKSIVGRKAKIRIYSVVNEIASVQLTVHKIDQNKKLIDDGFAEEAEESYISKENHQHRKQRRLEIDGNFSNITQPEKEFEKKIDKRHDLRQITPPFLTMCPLHVHLIGPFSPLELSLNGIARMKTSRVGVELTSVNSVILDDDILNFRGKFCVAANSTINFGKNQMTIRETTLMPNIPGLAVILALIFSPHAELRRDENKTRFVSVLTGLGFDKTQQDPFYGEHDTMLDVDFELTTDDIEAINQLRFHMSKLLMTKPNKNFIDLVGEEKTFISQKIRTLLLDTLNKSRPFMEINSPFDAFKWNIDQEETVVRSNPYGNRGMFGFIGIPKLYKMTDEAKDALIQHADELERCADNRVSFHRKICQLCNFEWQTAPELKIHLLSTKHKIRFQKLID